YKLFPVSTHLSSRFYPPLPRFDTPFSRFRTPFSHYDTPEIATKPVNKGFAAKGISLDLFG
ncbi:hypothetical protein WCD93_29470, partial [Klebsiella michiganensis]|uniref:hypothetical protein n=1 Tax=Klebsiella michiganensis TaxID=1134687 RepID=UPI0034D692FB